MKPFNKKGSGNWKSKGQGGSNRGGGGFGGGFGGGGFGGGARRGGGDRFSDDRPAMHSAVCNACNVDCEVPFKPNGRKPIYCSNCFRKEEGGGSSNSRFGGNDRNDRFDRNDSYEKPVFRSAPRENNDLVMKQLKELNDKMDQILNALMDLGDEAMADEDEIDV